MNKRGDNMEQCVNCQSVFEKDESDALMKNIFCTVLCEEEYRIFIKELYRKMGR